MTASQSRIDSQSQDDQKGHKPMQIHDMGRKEHEGHEGNGATNNNPVNPVATGRPKQESGQGKPVTRDTTPPHPLVTTTPDGTIRPAAPQIDFSALPMPESAAELMEEEITPPRHFVKGLFLEGLSLESGAPKCGKSFLNYQAGVAIASGQPFLGLETEQCGVLICDFETPKNIRQERMRTQLQGKAAPKNLYFLNRDQIPYEIGNGFEEVLEHYLDRLQDVQVVIIDTLDFILSDQKRTETQKRHAYRNMSPLKTIAQKRHCAIICTMHNRKLSNPDDFLENVSGSNGFTGAADTVIGLSRKRGEDEAVLQSDGRVAPAIEMYIRFDKDTCLWLPVGDRNKVDQQRRHDDFLKNPIVKGVIAVVDAYKGTWTGKVSQLIAESVFDTDKALGSYSEIKIGKFLRSSGGMFYKYAGISIIDKNEGNNKSAEYVMQRIGA